MYQGKPAGGSKTKQYILYVALGLICVACLVALYFMLFKKDAKPTDPDTDQSQQIDVSDQSASVPAVTEEADIRTPVKQDSDETTDPSSIDETNSTDETTDDASGDASIAVGDTIYVTVSELNVRGEPSTEAELVTVVYASNSLTVTELADGWYGIRTEDGVSGYVHADYVSKTAP